MISANYALLSVIDNHNLVDYGSGELNHNRNPAVDSEPWQPRVN
jgi:hypothetical protein